MNAFLQILAFIITILVLVSFHEGGHFLVARWLGIRVLSFSIGFGKPLFKFKDKRNTEYIIAVFPFGGYVRLLDERDAPVSVSELPFAFNQQPLFSRFLVVLAGPLTNFLFATLSFWLMFSIGLQVLRPVIGEIVPNSIAAKAGLKRGDQILSVNGTATPSLQKLLIAVVERLGEKSTMLITVKENSTKKATLYSLDLKDWRIDELNPMPLQSLGIIPYRPSALTYHSQKQVDSSLDIFLMRKYSPPIALVAALDEVKSFITFNYIMLKKMVRGQVSLSSLGGPITIFNTANTAFKQGVSVFLGFLGLISVMLGFINLLPIPGLDGGHILNFLIELIVRRPLSIKYQIISVQVGMFILLFLTLLATFNDLLRVLHQWNIRV